MMENFTNFHLQGFIKEIEYKSYLNQPLKEISWHGFNINDAPSYGLINVNRENIAYSKWVSPKRSRGYPLGRVYNTYGYEKVLTIIPIIKDEGKHGSRDMIQYSTISWMSLLNIYVIIGYYESAEISKIAKTKRKQKVTNQKFNNEFIVSQIKTLSQFSQTAKEWNDNFLKDNLCYLFTKSLESYRQISLNTGIIFHSEQGINNKLKQLNKNLDTFKSKSLSSSKIASKKEIKTTHRLEFLEKGSKATCELIDYLGGIYYLTFDEVYWEENKLVIQESKNTLNHCLPQLAEIQQTLFKFILYSNIENIYLKDNSLDFVLKFKITSSNINSSLLLPIEEELILSDFILKNSNLTSMEKRIIKTLNIEAIINKLTIQIN